ncbi:MAG: TIGR00159 family protein, partial [Chroococcidiopsidaceae cyanobacterium CP_BM_RX_35]|nr:TIGR00159 family protein [Chroococcidiopsidaceae cyanobacterium CP_BM_RX_35]
MENWWKQTLLNLDEAKRVALGGFLRENVDWAKPLLLQVLDIGLVLALIYMVLVVTDERRIRWMVQGFIVLLLASEVSANLGLRLLTFVLDKLVLGSAVAMAVLLQSEFRRFLEQLGRGEFRQLLQPARRAVSEPDSLVDEIVDAVKELSQNRIGALMILETSSPIDERVFSVPGVRLNAEV